MTIDITPEAVELLAHCCDGLGYRECATTLRALSAALTQSQDHLDRWINTCAAQGQTIFELQEALTASQAETAAAYDDALDAASGYMQRIYGDEWTFLSNHVDRERILAAIPADSKAALDRLIAEARADALSGPWDDKPDALTDAVEAAHPHHTKDFATYVEALELVSNRHSKGALVGLVNYLLAKNKAIPKGKDHE